LKKRGRYDKKDLKCRVVREPRPEPEASEMEPLVQYCFFELSKKPAMLHQPLTRRPRSMLPHCSRPTQGAIRHGSAQSGSLGLLAGAAQ
jgi:hypothetical protein